MRVHQTLLAVVLLVLSLFSGGNVCQAADFPAVTPDARNFIRPFILIFDRNDDQVIVFLANHPVYEAIEVKWARPFVVRATVTRVGGGFALESMVGEPVFGSSP